MRMGIHMRLLAAAILMIGATASTLGYASLRITRQFVRSRFEDRMFYLARYLALNAELGILIDNRAMLKTLAENLLSEKDVASVRIQNSQGEVLADIFRHGVEGPYIVEIPVVVKEPRQGARAFEWGESATGRKTIIGKVRISYSDQGIKTLLTRISKLFTLAGTLLACLGLLFFFVISRSIISPVQRLAAAARDVAGGDMTLRALPGNLPETRELALAFNAMLDFIEQGRLDLEAANQQMIRQRTLAEVGKFSMMVAHEVKNPLGIIKSSLDMLKADIFAGGNPQAPMLVEYMEDEIRRLNRLIEDFLRFARPVVPIFRLVEVNRMLCECVDRIGLQDTGGFLALQNRIAQAPCMVNADPDLLIRAFENIMKNAADACGEKGNLIVASSVEPDFWAASIEDDGPGIPEQHLDRIFEPFFTTRARGTGLGLAFVAQVIEMHHGTVAAENVLSGGARFTIRLPRSGGPSDVPAPVLPGC